MNFMAETMTFWVERLENGYTTTFEGERFVHPDAQICLKPLKLKVEELFENLENGHLIEIEATLTQTEPTYEP